MPSKLRMEFLSEGFKAVLSGDGVRSKVDAMAKAVAREAGEGFEPGVFLATYARQGVCDGCGSHTLA